jgi:hypothetical protein
MEAEPKPVQQPVAAKAAEPNPAPAPVAAKAAPAETKTDDDEGGTITEAIIRALASEKIQGGHKAGVAALLREYNVPNISKIDTARYGEFYEKLNAING